MRKLNGILNVLVILCLLMRSWKFGFMKFMIGWMWNLVFVLYVLRNLWILIWWGLMLIFLWVLWSVVLIGLLLDLLIWLLGNVICFVCFERCFVCWVSSIFILFDCLIRGMSMFVFFRLVVFICVFCFCCYCGFSVKFFRWLLILVRFWVKDFFKVLCKGKFDDLFFELICIL